MNNKKNKRLLHTIVSFAQKVKYELLVVFACGCYAGILFNQTMPFAEGWYTYYAQCINSGEVVYKDFDYLFTPLYIHFIALITKLFGYNLIVLRLVGVIFFCIIALLIFLIIKEIFDAKIAVIASITAAMYLQSEVVQVFYDYVRMMDIFACATMYLLVKYVKDFADGNNSKKYLILAGITNACFVLTKQNMGLVFVAYTIVLILALSIVKKDKIVQIFKREIFYLLGISIPLFLTLMYMVINGSLSSFFNQTGTKAIAAKGGIEAILFHWLINNKDSFVNAGKFAFVILILLAIGFLLNQKYNCSGNILSAKINSCGAILFACCCIISFILFAKNENCARLLDGHTSLSPYSIFLIVTPLFIGWVIYALILFFKQKEISDQILLYITISGSYFAISWGCGMSAGLAEGQATIGVALIVALLLSIFQFKYAEILKIIVVIVCFLLTLQCASKKMIYTYNWWGMDESSLWESDLLSDDISILHGIQMSEETLDAYETIYHLVEKYTTKEDSIYTFPQIPIFYTICDRKDPGVREKVQWFDVTSDSSIANDIKILKKNPPKVIIIYDTSEYAYNAHESLFRSGNISATRKLKQFLLDYATTHGYTFYGKVKSTESNQFIVYYKTDNDFSRTYQLDGNGTQKSPYKIKSPEDLQFLSESVKNGNDYANVYFEQTQDIDLSGIGNWTPIGEYDSECSFKGIYDGKGYIIKNMVCDRPNENIGLFGKLGGIVCNLGIVDSNISGECVGIITSHAENPDALIINCYTKCNVTGVRAGGIADNFEGKIINCISYSNCIGMDSAGGISYQNGYSENVYALDQSIKSEIMDSYGDVNVKICSEKYLKSEMLIQNLNQKVSQIKDCTDHFNETNEEYEEESNSYYEAWMSKIHLNNWIKSKAGFPMLKSGEKNVY